LWRFAQMGEARLLEGSGLLGGCLDQAMLDQAMMGAMTRATMLISLMRMFSAGPEVSLKGSPTVSPITAAAWASPPFFSPSISPFSMAFLALSQAPPALAIISAR